ncbi:MAG: photosynthetic complex assembly protein PuhC [Tabrizicola sp.]|uniref:photosynthetic complex assembly protein PuhC n=1 Tax=Tabrizicola sp. TaxID=2005166 RepID=UPI00273650D4|nr:photosynthetic complex assembly protein PuhC [Tabrizicola sp.]MDP3265152.1 photosynthetic complex assembly protein PuhC [Tabrizicola sp.]MDP3646920.1 photosynthetic complex assembly protein PuhC [Paracoccaceae bacterium]MDZ4069220.1 photosynthetic complex assembly protein PuhC [Tabrizicola sp.]
MANRPPLIHEPGFHSQNPETVPKALLLGMLALALSALAIASYASFTGREPVGQPQASEVVREKWIVMEGLNAQAVIVKNADGSVLLDLPHGGFVTVIQSGIHTERRRQGVDQTKPVRIVEYANGRLVAEDPETGWSAELYAFGADNKAAFERLLDQK